MLIGNWSVAITKSLCITLTFHEFKMLVNKYSPQIDAGGYLHNSISFGKNGVGLVIPPRLSIFPSAIFYCLYTCDVQWLNLKLIAISSKGRNSCCYNFRFYNNPIFFYNWNK